MAVSNFARCSGSSFPLYLCLATISSLDSLAACNAFTAESVGIRLPAEFPGSALRLDFAGFGGHNRCHYAGGGFTGEVIRSESRLGIFEPLFVANNAQSSFTAADSLDLGGLSANSWPAQNVAAIPVFALDPEELTYRGQLAGIALAADWRPVVRRPTRGSLKEMLLLLESHGTVIRADDLLDSTPIVHRTKAWRGRRGMPPSSWHCR